MAKRITKTVPAVARIKDVPKGLNTDTVDEGTIKAVFDYMKRGERRQKTLVLTASIAAARAVSGLHGGFVMVMQRLGTADFDTVVAVIRSGLPAADRNVVNVEALVFQHGVGKSASYAVKFVDLLMNGGRKREDRDPDQIADNSDDPEAEGDSDGEESDPLE